MRISDWSSDVCSSDLSGGSNPPTFIVHGSRLKTLPEHYRRYLENFFRKRFKLVGTPIRFEFREGENPYGDRKNVLTEKQIASRRRMMRHVKGGSRTRALLRSFSSGVVCGAWAGKKK